MRIERQVRFALIGAIGGAALAASFASLGFAVATFFTPAGWVRDAGLVAMMLAGFGGAAAARLSRNHE